MPDTFMADVDKEGADPFAALEKDTPSESPTEDQPKVEEPKEGDVLPEDNVPFHKHPRWIERENELRSLREKEEENNRVITELSAFKEEAAQKLSALDKSDSKIPDWFQELFGDNEEAWRKYAEHEKQKEAEFEQRVVARQEGVRRQQESETNYWNKWVDDEIKKLGDEIGIDLSTKKDKDADGNPTNIQRNELIKTMLDYRPTDENNNFDFKAGYRIYETLKAKNDDPARSVARKQIADITTKSSTGEKSPKDYMTPADLRGKSWSAL